MADYSSLPSYILFGESLMSAISIYGLQSIFKSINIRENRAVRGSLGPKKGSIIPKPFPSGGFSNFLFKTSNNREFTAS